MRRAGTPENLRRIRYDEDFYGVKRKHIAFSEVPILIRNFRNRIRDRLRITPGRSARGYRELIDHPTDRSCRARPTTGSRACRWKKSEVPARARSRAAHEFCAVFFHATVTAPSETSVITCVEDARKPPSAKICTLYPFEALITFVRVTDVLPAVIDWLPNCAAVPFRRYAKSSLPKGTPDKLAGSRPNRQP